MGTGDVGTLLTGRGLVESPRWHGDRLYFSDWSAGEVRRDGGDPRTTRSPADHLPGVLDRVHRPIVRLI